MKPIIAVLFCFLCACTARGQEKESSAEYDSLKQYIYYHRFNTDFPPYYQGANKTTLWNTEKSRAANPKEQLTVYNQIIVEANKKFENQSFKQAGIYFTLAFNVNSDKGKVMDRYKAALAFSKAGMVDSAFSQLIRITEKGNFYNYLQLQNEQGFKPLQRFPLWEKIIRKAMSNAESHAEKLNSQLPDPNNP